MTVLCYLLVQPGGDQRERFVEAQPVLAKVRKLNILNPTESTSDFITLMTGVTPSRSAVAAQFEVATTFVDDDLWLKRTSDRFGFDGLSFVSSGVNRPTLLVSGCSSPFTDPRLLQLAHALRLFRGAHDIALWGEEPMTWRIMMRGPQVFYEPDRSADLLGPADLSSSAEVLADAFDAATITA